MARSPRSGRIRSGPAAAWGSSVLDRRPADALAGDDELHDAGGAVADLEAHDIAHALLVRQLFAPAIVAKGEEALVDDVEGGLGAHPLHHGRFGGMGQSR